MRPSAEELFAAALDLAHRGFKVFRCAPGAKWPVAKKWQDEATSDPSALASLWLDANGMALPYNPGIATGDLLVVDADVKSGLAGIDDLNLLNVPADTFTVQTPSGGEHRYFRPSEPVRGSVRKIANGLDVRAAGNLVVGPGAWLDPTVPENRGIGGRYWIKTDAPVANAPTELEILCGRPREKQNNGDDTGEDDPVDVAAAMAWLEDREPAYEGQGGDHWTFATLAGVRDHGLSKDMALAVVREWNQRCDPPWSVEDLKRKIDNVWRYASGPAGAKAVSTALNGLDIAANMAPPMLTDGGWFLYGEEFDPADYAWLVHEVLPTQGVGLLLGESGSAKTFAALHLAAQLARAGSWHGCDIDDAGATLYFAAEGAHGLRKRLAGLKLHTGEPALAIAGRPVDNLGADAQVEALKNDVRQRLPALRSHFGVPVRLVIIDTWSAAGLSVDENDNAQVAAALKRLEGLARDLEVFVLVVHHPKKGHATEARGAGALRANVDVLMTLEVSEATDERKLTLAKSKDAEERVLGGFRLKRVELGADRKGRMVTTAVVEECAPPVIMEGAPTGWATLQGTRGTGFTADGREVVMFPSTMSATTKARIIDYAVTTGQIEAADADTWVWIKKAP